MRGILRSNGLKWRPLLSPYRVDVPFHPLKGVPANLAVEGVLNLLSSFPINSTQIRDQYVTLAVSCGHGRLIFTEKYINGRLLFDGLIVLRFVGG